MKQLYYDLCSHYSHNSTRIASLWQEIETHYRKPHRAYHTLHHLKHLYCLLSPFKETLNWHTLLWSIFYHDVIYTIPSSTNEEESAALAQTHL